MKAMGYTWCGAQETVYHFVRSSPMVRMLYTACRDVTVPVVKCTDVGGWVVDDPNIAFVVPLDGIDVNALNLHSWLAWDATVAAHLLTLLPPWSPLPALCYKYLPLPYLSNVLWLVASATFCLEKGSHWHSRMSATADVSPVVRPPIRPLVKALIRPLTFHCRIDRPQ